jgi:glycosyltransferase involved in cell wall biosynthesis
MPKLYPRICGDVLYSPVPCPNISNLAEIRGAVRAELNTPDNTVVIIQASRLEPLKGQIVLLLALAQQHDIPAWVCWIAGGVQRPHEAQYLQKLHTQVQKLGIADRVQFLGQRADVSRLLAAADIYCQPNIEPETFGIAFVEALYAGLPVVTTAIGGGLEIVDESCGRLVAPNDANALSQVLRLLITNSGERADLAAKGSARAYQLCDPARQLTQLHALLSRLVKQEAVA